MSRSQPTSNNPSVYRYTWKGSEGKLVYWDKESEKEVDVKLPFEFLVLDQLSTIAGYSDEDASSYWSNEVRSVGKEELNVRTAKGTREIGLYKDLECRSKGAKYAKSIYIAENGHISNFRATGAALSAWIDFSNANSPEVGKVVLKGKSEEQKKGATKYFTPVFEWITANESENEEAIALDRELQEFLASRNSAKQDDEVVESNELSGFEKAKAQAVKLGYKEDKVVDPDDEPFDLSEIPF